MVNLLFVVMLIETETSAFVLCVLCEKDSLSTVRKGLPRQSQGLPRCSWGLSRGTRDAVADVISARNARIRRAATLGWRLMVARCWKNLSGNRRDVAADV